ncbi:MAG: AmmeMemoRadiSam system radical SAM enzyme [Ignisphaera sp.]|nr:AmmeMemoRadiSam system radical SAM enzyme [Ignisphaera sp.]
MKLRVRTLPREALLYRVIDSVKKLVECTACPRRCKLLDEQFGFCGIRWNFEGKLYLVSYGLAIAVAIDPIEKKPLYHFNPGSLVFSMSTTGCSWGCQFCQNWDISQRRVIAGWKLPPDLAVRLATAYGAQGMTYTYNEPIVFLEYAYDTGTIAKKHGLFNTMVTNGYMTDESIDIVVKFIDAAAVDLKGHGDREFARKFSMVYDTEPIFNALIELKRKGVFIEITDLVVPRYGDDLEKARRLARWIAENLGPETPVHFLRFHPDYRMLDLPSTNVKILEKHVEVAKGEGLKHVYIGNVPGHQFENTYCANCGRLLIRRMGFDILEVNLREGMQCPYCGYKVNVAGKIHPMYKLDRFIHIPLEAFSEFIHIKNDSIREFVLSGV